ncbi:hypothetical protein HMN09_00317100 [Mycena chlorophos]|uniref:Rap1 Myb domain-containing protein n=1 Tax=Mycena chlorophos TaxID=658473 RepID=A0A8H6WHQ7_MYCCL|nr:hypothetical protein HMN09_00317100 [Mycena chlorophos]
MGSKRKFTAEEDRKLVEYLACARPEDGLRTGHKIYKTLVSNPQKWPWASEHPYGSWRRRYRNASKSFDLRIAQYLKNGRRHPEDSNAKGPDTKVRVVRFTEDDIQNLCVFLAEKTLGRRRGGIALYKTLVEDEDGTRPWAKRHPAVSWLTYYARRREVLDPRISAIQLQNADLWRTATGTEPEADNAWPALPESAPPILPQTQKGVPDISATRKRPLPLDPDEETTNEFPFSSASLSPSLKRSTGATTTSRRADSFLKFMARRRLPDASPEDNDFSTDEGELPPVAEDPAKPRKRIRLQDTESEEDRQDGLDALLGRVQRMLQGGNPARFEEEEESDCSSDEPSLPGIEMLTQSITSTSSEPAQQEYLTPTQKLRDIDAIFDEHAVRGATNNLAQPSAASYSASAANLPTCTEEQPPPLPADGTSQADEDMGPSHEEPIATLSTRTSLTERMQALAAARGFRPAEPSPSSTSHTFDMHAYLFDDAAAPIDALSAMVAPETAAAAARPPKRRPGDGPVQKPLPVFFAGRALGSENQPVAS